MKFEWESIDSSHKRAKVPGGWIVEAFEDVNRYSNEDGTVNGWDWRVAMVFVPDQNHTWVIEN